MAFYIISFLLLFAYVAIILYYRQSWLHIKTYGPVHDEKSYTQVFISVIIAARNEEKNIGACIISIIAQTYPEGLFEIIIVDDHSSDATVSIARSLKKDFIKIICLKDFTGAKNLNSYKKKAIETAISTAKGNLIVTTDADCILPTRWLETIADFYAHNDPVFIAAPVVYKNPLPKDSILKRFLKVFQSLDFMTLQGITGASVNTGFHSMCNGANLAYTKKVFAEVEGFEGIDNIASGDDMLLMHKVQKIYPDRIAFLKSPDVVVETQPADTLKDFINQRIRWASKADKYTDPKITRVLLLVYVFNVWILLASMYSFLSLSVFYLFIFLLIVKTFIELIFLYPVAKFFNKQKLLWWFFPAQPFHILYTIFAGWMGKFGSYNWKGRRVK